MDAVRLSLIAALGFGLTACSTFSKDDDSFAGKLDEIADNWRDGQDDLEKGQELLDEGRKELSKQQERRARELAGLRETEDDILAKRQEITRVAATGGSPDKLEKLGDQINRLEKKAREHEEEAEDAQDDIEDARRKIERGTRLVSRGEAAMARAEERYRNDIGGDFGEAFGDA